MEVNMDKLAELDGHWNEVMELAVKYGFITQAYGGRRRWRRTRISLRRSGRKTISNGSGT